MKRNTKTQGWKRLLFIILPYFFIVGFFQFIGFLVAGVDLANESIQETTQQQVIITSFGFVGNFAVIFLFMKLVDKEPFVNLGFHWKNRFQEVIIGLMAGLLIMGIGYWGLIFFQQIKFTKITFLWNEMLLMCIVFLMVAITEETFFRGYVLRNLLDSTSKNAALILSAIIFAIMHGLNPHITWVSYINLFLSGILLGLPYLYTHNLWFPISLHFSWNFFQSLFGFNISGRDSYSLIEFDIVEKNIINGGEFGFESSVLSIIIQVFLIVIVINYFNNN